MRISDWSSDVCSSDLSCKDQPAIRLGLREIRGLSEDVANAITTARAQHPFRNVADLCLRANLDEKARRALAEAGALRSLAGHRNDARRQVAGIARQRRSEEHTSELQSLMRISYAVFCLKKKPYNHDSTQSRVRLHELA